MSDCFAALTPKEESLFMEALATREYRFARDVFILALHTGMRLGELKALTFKDIDFEHRVIHVESKGTRRTMPMSSEVYDILLRRSMVLGEVPQRTLRAALTIWRRIASRLGIRHFVFHALRNTFALKHARSDDSGARPCSLMGTHGPRLVLQHYVDGSNNSNSNTENND